MRGSHTREVVVSGAIWRLVWNKAGFDIFKRRGFGKWDSLLTGAGKLDLQWLLKKAEEAESVGIQQAVPKEVIAAFTGTEEGTNK